MSQAHPARLDRLADPIFILRRVGAFLLDTRSPEHHLTQFFSHHSANFVDEPAPNLAALVRAGPSVRIVAPQRARPVRLLGRRLPNLQRHRARRRARGPRRGRARHLERQVGRQGLRRPPGRVPDLEPDREGVQELLGRVPPHVPRHGPRVGLPRRLGQGPQRG